MADMCFGENLIGTTVFTYKKGNSMSGEKRGSEKRAIRKRFTSGWMQHEGH